MNQYKPGFIKRTRRGIGAVIGRRIGGRRIFPVATKIVLIYVLFILLSNFSSHYISLTMYRGELIKLMRQLLVKDLRDVYTFANTQYEISGTTGDRDTAIRQIEAKSVVDFKNSRSLLLGIDSEGNVGIRAARTQGSNGFTDIQALRAMKGSLKRNVGEGFISFTFGGERYFGVYKYNPNWKMFLLRAEEYNEFYRNSRSVFQTLSIIILIITIGCAVIGVYIINYVLRFIRNITNDIMSMARNNEIRLIDLKGSQADDVTFLGMAFNSLSDSINLMMKIFQKFASRDVVIRAYEDKGIKLEGSRRELTCLFSDIKSFTYMTEVLGTDIINLLNLHYTRVFHDILKLDGIIGSIIGDALLAVYGIFDGESARVKSYQAVVSGYKIHDVARGIREGMERIREKLLEENGSLTPLEERVYKAVRLEVGVGIDGGSVFYGNLGSYERMTNTVIGDTVNSASRLEGLNRVYHAPVICSEYIKKDIVKNVPDHGLVFVELDVVMVKGKTEGKKVFWPVFKKDMDRSMRQDLRHFSEGLELYYAGQWKKANGCFSRCSLPIADVFVDRTSGGRAPGKWNGIWTMDTK